MPKVRVNDINIYYEEHGQGEPLVMIMGLGGDHMAWYPNVPGLSAHYRLILFDNRGAGQTDAPDIPYSLRGMADDTAGLLTALGIERAHIIGISMGGAIAQELAINYPEKVRKLVLGATLGRIDGFLRCILLGWIGQVKCGIDPTSRIHAALPWVFTPLFLDNDEMVQRTIEFQLNNPYPQPPHAYIRQTQALLQLDTLHRAEKITAPTLVIVGREDILTPPRYSRELADHIPHATLAILPQGGHGFSLEYPDAFNEKVMEFLRQ